MAAPLVPQRGVIAGLIERRIPGEEKSRRQVTFSSDLIYDALRKHEPDHILLRATRQDAAHQLADLKRLGDLLRRAKGRIEYRRLDRISPLAVPCCWRSARSASWTAPPRTSFWTSPRRN